jgi:hypothetical protein
MIVLPQPPNAGLQHYYILMLAFILQTGCSKRARGEGNRQAVSTFYFLLQQEAHRHMHETFFFTFFPEEDTILSLELLSQFQC